jgi:hypothetical protein
MYLPATSGGTGPKATFRVGKKTYDLNIYTEALIRGLVRRRFDASFEGAYQASALSVEQA